MQKNALLLSFDNSPLTVPLEQLSENQRKYNNRLRRIKDLWKMGWMMKVKVPYSSYLGKKQSKLRVKRKNRFAVEKNPAPEECLRKTL